MRHRELRAPNGFGDELRAVLVSDAATWGGLTLGRASDREPFTPAEVALVASVSSYLAEGLQRAMLLAALSARHDQDELAGFALLAADNSITLADTTAETWLSELGGTGPDAPLRPWSPRWRAAHAASPMDGRRAASSPARESRPRRAPG